MVSSQGALPNVRPPSGLVRTSSLGTPLINLDATSVILIFVWVASLHAPPYASKMPPSIKEREALALRELFLVH